MCQTCRDTAAASTSASPDTVEDEKERFARFRKTATVTLPKGLGAFMGAPTPEGYGIGYRDVLNRDVAFILPEAAAVEFAHSILQEIEADKKAKAQGKLRRVLLKSLANLDAGLPASGIVSDLGDFIVDAESA